MSRPVDDVGAPEHLDAAHDVAAFDSGAPILDDWLRESALANEKHAASRTYVISAAGRVVGWYSLATGAVARQHTAGRVRRNLEDSNPVMVVGRLAVDKAYQGRGFGMGLLRDAVLRAQQAAAIGRIRAIVVQAFSDDAKRFYERCGFSPSTEGPMTLMARVPDVERVLRDR